MLIFRDEVCLNGVIDWDAGAKVSGCRCAVALDIWNLITANVTNVDAPLNLHSTTFAGDILNPFDYAPVLLLRTLCVLYSVPEHGKCYGMYRRMQASCARGTVPFTAVIPRSAMKRLYKLVDSLFHLSPPPPTQKRSSILGFCLVDCQLNW